MYSMVCEIKFNNPLLDSPETYPMTPEAQHNLLVEKLDALFSYFTDGKEKLPDDLPMSVIKVILGLANLAKVPGLMDNPDKVGQPSRWNDEDGFILSARVQIYLLKHPDATVHKAVVTCSRNLFKNLSDEGVYRRYLDEAKKEHSMVWVAKHRIDHLKDINKYEERSEEHKQQMIDIFKQRLADTHKQLFPNSSTVLFKYIPEVAYLTRIDPECL
jgi:hypothetical protein